MPTPAIAYVRVSTRQQRRAIAGQITAVTTGADESSLTLVDVCTETAQSAWLDSKPRPVFQDVLNRLARKEARILLATRADRLTRNPDDASIRRAAIAQGWDVVLLMPRLDTRDAGGWSAFYNAVAAGQAASDLTSWSTKAGVKQVRLDNPDLPWGRPWSTEDAVRTRIITEIISGEKTYKEIGDGLTADGIATPRGGRQWWPSSIRGIATSAIYRYAPRDVADQFDANLIPIRDALMALPSEWVGALPYAGRHRA